MSVQLVIELQEAKGAQAVLHAVDAYKKRLQSSIDRTKRNLAKFEKRYAVETAHFLKEMTAEDLEGGDIEYVTWAGEAEILAGLESELRELVNANYQLP
ncbi:MAG: hypothetical protein ACI8V2_003084 [Candidatus Latescibacterota bacterium]|jgi:hypothetical protein